jgi:hypothetical protein
MFRTFEEGVSTVLVVRLHPAGDGFRSLRGDPPCCASRRFATANRRGARGTARGEPAFGCPARPVRAFRNARRRPLFGVGTTGRAAGADPAVWCRMSAPRVWGSSHLIRSTRNVFVGSEKGRR